MSTLSLALKQLRQGGMIILVDDEDRENEGDLIAAAEFATPEVVNFMATHGRGLICLAMTGEQADRLNLPPMTAHNRTRRSTAFTVSIEAVDGITTGISAFDRSRTIAVASSPAATAQDVVSPGHVFPLRAVAGGVLTRNGHTEGAVDLMRLAGLNPCGVICEIMSDSGHMARRPEIDRFAGKHGIPVLAIKDIVEHRLRSENLVEEVASAMLPSGFAEEDMRVHAFRSRIDGQEHLAVVKHPLPKVPLVRLHSECLTGEAFGSLRCDCGAQLQEALKRISESDGGALIYLRGHEGRGIGLANKIKAYALQDQGLDTAEANIALGFAAEERDYAVAAQILKALGIGHMDLLSNNPDKENALVRFGLAVRERLPLPTLPNAHNMKYLATKREKFGHTLAHTIGDKA